MGSDHSVSLCGGVDAVVLIEFRHTGDTVEQVSLQCLLAFAEAERDFASYLQSIGVGFDPAPRD